ncbi:MAG: AI-2E family transporter [Nanoarchaeota archaeon]|nr:AI-2E family transporter [Nanoarchaeota archaeon]
MKNIQYKSYVPVILFALLMIASFLILKPLLLALFVGALLAYAFYPLYTFMVKKTGKPTISSFLVCFLVLLIVIIPAGLLIKVLIQESYVIYLLVKQKLAVGLFKNCTTELCIAISDFSQSEAVSSQLKEITRSATNLIIGKGSAFLVNIPRLAINLFVVFFTMFFFLKDGEALLKSLNNYFQLRHKNYVLILGRMREIIHGIVYGFLLIAMIQGIFGALGFFLFGIPSPLFWGLIMGFFALIPAIGTGVIWVPASLILLLDGVFQNSTPLILKGIGLFVYSFIFVGSIDNILRPKLMGDKAKVHVAIIMLGIFGGILLIGPLGVIFGPLVLSLTTEVMKVYLVGKKVKS